MRQLLEPGYGCIVYQEQVIEIFRRLAGYSLGQADMVRRAMSKKKAKDIEVVEVPKKAPESPLDRQPASGAKRSKTAVWLL